MATKVKVRSYVFSRDKIMGKVISGSKDIMKNYEYTITEKLILYFWISGVNYSEHRETSDKGTIYWKSKELEISQACLRVSRSLIWWSQKSLFENNSGWNHTGNLMISFPDCFGLEQFKTIYE